MSAGRGMMTAASARRTRRAMTGRAASMSIFSATGPAVSRTLRAQVQRHPRIRRVGDLCITDLAVSDGIAAGAVGFSVSDGRKVAIAAKTVVLATGGLTRLYRRNSASANMGGDGYALALRAGARLVDMEFVQFFPIGHLAPRLIGMDPIMWDPFRYKLGGRLLNSDGREFIDAYGVSEDGTYKATRDLATYAIQKEVEAGRGSPSGGVYLSFRHVPADKLRAAFGPVIDRLAKNGIDLAQNDVEVAPIAHYHMGGVRVIGLVRVRHSRPFRRGRGRGRRQRRQPSLRQRHHRGPGVRAQRRIFGRRARSTHGAKFLAQRDGRRRLRPPRAIWRGERGQLRRPHRGVCKRRWRAMSAPSAPRPALRARLPKSRA